MKDQIAIIGYSGHSFVVIEALKAQGIEVAGYFDLIEKEFNPFQLKYLGKENYDLLSDQDWFVAIGDNLLRRSVIEQFKDDGRLLSVFHPKASISSTCSVGSGVFVSGHAVINAVSNIGTGTIINTGAIVEHGCCIGAFSHIAPGSVLCGDVSIGENSFIGANSVVREGVSIGRNVIVGAGSVVIRDINNDEKVAGNPAKRIA